MSTEIKASSRKNRTAMSCDRCKARKTKCNNPSPGPCDYCKAAGTTCTIDPKQRKQRPYYFVSEEEYRHMTKVLKHYVPDRELNLANLRELSAELEKSPESRETSVAKDQLDDDSQNQASPANVSNIQDALVLEEIGDMHEQLGCMLVDSSGQYRYVGPNAGISFNAAVRLLKEGIYLPKSDAKDIIPGLTTTRLPPATPESMNKSNAFEDVELPPREACYQYVSTFFNEIHCLFWLYSSELFHTRLEATYAERSSSSASWLCSLYSIFAIGSLKAVNSNDARAAADWLALAKSFVSQTCDEANIDSVRALILLSLALQAHCFNNAAYLHAGTAVRVAYSLGLHVDKHAVGGLIERELSRRVAWSVFIFDQEIALRSGKPCGVADSGSFWQAPFPSEHILNPGTSNPCGYLQLSATLSQLTKTVCQVLYPEPIAGSRKLSLKSISDVLMSLREWMATVPPYLSRFVHVAPSQQRCVALLHVRYFSVVILATRPFLLCSVVRRQHLQHPAKRKCYEELGQMCISAAEKSFSILQAMSKHRLLSSLVPTDFNYVLELIQIFLITYGKSKDTGYLDHARDCLTILQSMDNIGWTQKGIQEVQAQLTDNGVLQSPASRPAIFENHFDAFLESGGQNMDMFFPGTNIGYENTNYNDFSIPDMDFEDSVAPDQLLHEMSELPPMPSFLTP